MLKLKNYIAIALVFLPTLLQAKQLIHKPYFNASNFNPAVIDIPASADSKDLKEEIQQIIKLQENIELTDIDFALDEKELRPEIVTEYVNNNLSRQKYPKLYKLLDRVSSTSCNITDSIKNHYKIPRPYLLTKTVQPLISPSLGYAYPSGHTTGSYTYAAVLSLLMPKYSQDFKNRANEIAWHRVQVGMHYPQDLVGGKQLALVILGGLIQNQEFQQDFAEALQELKQHNLIK
jgi:acid phosphatase (class A)